METTTQNSNQADSEKKPGGYDENQPFAPGNDGEFLDDSDPEDFDEENYDDSDNLTDDSDVSDK